MINDYKNFSNILFILDYQKWFTICEQEQKFYYIFNSKRVNCSFYYKNYLKTHGIEL